MVAVSGVPCADKDTDTASLTTMDDDKHIFKLSTGTQCVKLSEILNKTG